MEKENKIEKNYNQNLLGRKLKVLIADDEKIMVDEIISKLDANNEDYEIIGYALSNEEERKKIEELKPDIVITDIFRGNFAQKNAGGFEIVKEYSEKYFLPKFMIISYTTDFYADNIIGRYNKLPDIDYERIKNDIHAVKIAERSYFMRGYEEKNIQIEKNMKKNVFLDRLKFLLQ